MTVAAAGTAVAAVLWVAQILRDAGGASGMSDGFPSATVLLIMCILFLLRNRRSCLDLRAEVPALREPVEV